MKLKKLMRKNGIKFPEWAKFAAQDSNRTMWFFGEKPEFEPKYGVWGRCHTILSPRRLPELASNYKTKVVTREEYEA